MKSSVLCILALTIVVGKSVESANILVLMPLPFPSHTRTYMPLFKELALRGHNVTFYSAFPFKEEIPNLKTVMVDNFLEGFILPNSIRPQVPSANHNRNPFRAEKLAQLQCRKPNPFSYVADFRLEADGQMDYFQRISNLMIGLFTRVTGYYWYLPRQEATMRTYFDYAGVDTLPPLKDMLAATTMSLVDGHHAISYVAPNLPNIVPVGGIHISANSTLPEDLKSG
ncbi:UDP-glycosyltransferase UGT4-like [Nilaparvata lugens]|uniref:UDP-glycosyltransferase UGT4-like n=1 Tax=Nilaparvata lugens TaxID=108931 RepID=UPI00193E1E56|nr:UDP-glycosyltransferase UGT4-like [Nilaparvata lugens]